MELTKNFNLSVSPLKPLNFSMKRASFAWKLNNDLFLKLFNLSEILARFGFYLGQNSNDLCSLNDLGRYYTILIMILFKFTSIYIYFNKSFIEIRKKSSKMVYNLKYNQ